MSHFETSQYDRAYPDGIEDHWWHLARSRIVLGEVAASTSPRAAVLDVGCGRGVTVKYLREHGIDCTGVDLARPRPLPGMEPFLRLEREAAELPAETRRRVEVILLLDVIEHLLDPVAFMRSLAGAFERLARVIVTVPARPEVWSNYDVFYGHQRRYTPPMIADLADQLRWTLAHQGYLFRATYPPARALCALGRDRAVSLVPPGGLSRRVHRLLSGLMVLERRVLPRWVPGTSILARLELPARA